MAAVITHRKECQYPALSPVSKAPPCRTLSTGNSVVSGYAPKQLLWRSMRRRSPSRLPGLKAVENQQSSSTDIIWTSEGSRFRVLDEDDMESVGKPTPSDFYELLNIGENANKTQLKKAYRAIFRQCHPDIVGSEANDVCELVNIAYDILSDEEQRSIYDSELEQYKKMEGEAFDGRPKSEWGPNANVTENRAVFVDELSCIGCRMCSGVAPETFGIEETWGRARVKTQWGNTEENIADAIDSCPVDCIYWVQRKQLPLLEYIMGVCNRINVAAMMNGRVSPDNPFQRAETFLKSRKNSKIDASFNRDTLRIHNDKLQSAIANAWLQLPDDIREGLWPQYNKFQEDEKDGTEGNRGGGASSEGNTQEPDVEILT
eukprot:CAMPEP_0185253822 /NCGR_PEP_ID=MMETSP1359-20130426/2403_1 /TAXON_ID=552665 /ORGANISM="Bigelowiella longifila, Strain CCMP242" /LENGTH=373 /DNA_ID=CAMNT_0027836251 /DNA_START=162 /DNA_END=1283 /DNA_ORIENTATION=-